ncbi:MAG: response regulator [Chitinophagaceae bacterium]
MSHKKICIIDDDKILIFLTRKLINSHDSTIEISEYGDGHEAVEFFKSNLQTETHYPDVIFLDISMPVMDGWEFLEEYGKIPQEIRKNIQLYMFSSSISAHDMERATSNPNVNDYLTKPLTKEKLVEILAKVPGSENS